MTICFGRRLSIDLEVVSRPVETGKTGREFTGAGSARADPGASLFPVGSPAMSGPESGPR